MARCDLSIELDEPERTYRGGETITGSVHVLAEANVTCKKLEVSSGWRTHGKGNVKTGIHQTQVVFQGNWQAGEKASYRFSLPVGSWPPTYHGQYLNVDQAIDARADIPWAFDPHATQVLMVRPESIDPSEQAKLIKSSQHPGWVAAVIVIVVVASFIAFASAFVFTAPFLLIFMLPMGLFGAATYVYKKVLPGWVLGNVTVDWPTTTATPGQTLSGTLTIAPKRRVAIQAINVSLEGLERCVSGSGSNRTTHTHTLATINQTIAGTGDVKPHLPNVYPLTIQVPSDAPLSVSLPDNELLWVAKVKVDLPRWPDWTQVQPISVVPPGTASGGSAPAAKPATASAANPMSQTAETVSFDETVNLIQASLGDAEQLSMIVEAVTGIPMRASIDIDRKLLYAGDEEKLLRRGEVAWWATAPQTDPPLPLVILVPESTAAGWHEGDRNGVAGELEIIGFDPRHQRLRARFQTRV